MIEIDFTRSNPLAKSSLFFLFVFFKWCSMWPAGHEADASIADSHVWYWCALKVTCSSHPMSKNGSLSTPMTLLSKKRKSEWEKEGCLVCENRTHPYKTCYDDILDLQGENIVMRNYSANSHGTALWPITNYFQTFSTSSCMSKYFYLFFLFHWCIFFSKWLHQCHPIPNLG